MRRARLSSLLCGALALAADAAASGGDASALVQESVRSHRRAAEVVNIGSSLVDTPSGPTAITSLGEIRGVREENFTIFRGIPYSERIPRWHAPTPKAPWQPETLDATEFGPACIGSHVGLDEAEDCLYLNIWLPNTRFVNMPVIIYFHGGINQHGSGHETDRHGEHITQSERHPAVFVNFDFRLGIFGWFSMPGSGVPENLGLQDQQAAMRWVHDHIAAFGGDPGRVTLMGQSEGSGIILSHLVAPGSAGLFHRVALHSPPADIWPRSTNRDRTKFMIERLGCNRPKISSALRCMQRKSAGKIWQADWVSSTLANIGPSPSFMNNAVNIILYYAAHGIPDSIAELGWHAVIDNETVAGEPRVRIREGRWNKAEMLITTIKNESQGIFPSGLQVVGRAVLNHRLLKEGDFDRAVDLYNQSLEATGVHAEDEQDILRQIITDKMWTCDIRSLARDFARGGGKVHVGMFWHEPSYDPTSVHVNKNCEHGAGCHSSDMLYALPQSGHYALRGRDAEFGKMYVESFLSFVSGDKHPWAPYTLQDQPFTFYDLNGTRRVPQYRREQCDVLDGSMGENLPEPMRAGH